VAKTIDPGIQPASGNAWYERECGAAEYEQARVRDGEARGQHLKRHAGGEQHQDQIDVLHCS
jgi:hypothetical protein